MSLLDFAACWVHRDYRRLWLSGFPILVLDRRHFGLFKLRFLYVFACFIGWVARPFLGPAHQGLTFFLFSLFGFIFLFLSAMAHRSFPRTLSVDVSCFMQSKSREDVAKIIFDKYNEVYGTPTIQILPGGVARITFKEAVAKQSLLRHDKISLDGRSCKIFADRRLVWVQVHHYPSEAFDIVIEEFFMSYGTVKLVKRQHWVALPDVQTGTRLVGILLDKQVPRNVIIGGFNCKTWYRGQPVTCDLCGKEGHVFSNCPIRGKCRRCMEPGHFARDCPRSPWKTPPGPAPASGSVDPTPAEASAPLVSTDLRDNQLDELDSQSVFADALSSAAPSVSSGDEGESVNEDEDFETEEEADEAEEVDEA